VSHFLGKKKDKKKRYTQKHWVELPIKKEIMVKEKGPTRRILLKEEGLKIYLREKLELKYED